MIEGEVKKEIKTEVKTEVKSENVESTRGRRRMEPIFVSRPSSLVTKKGQYKTLICYAIYVSDMYVYITTYVDDKRQKTLLFIIFNFYQFIYRYVWASSNATIQSLQITNST